MKRKNIHAIIYKKDFPGGVQIVSHLENGANAGGKKDADRF